MSWCATSVSSRLFISHREGELLLRAQNGIPVDLREIVAEIITYYRQLFVHPYSLLSSILALIIDEC